MTTQRSRGLGMLTIPVRRWAGSRAVWRDGAYCVDSADEKAIPIRGKHAISLDLENSCWGWVLFGILAPSVWEAAESGNIGFSDSLFGKQSDYIKIRFQASVAYRLRENGDECMTTELKKQIDRLTSLSAFISSMAGKYMLQRHAERIMSKARGRCV